MTCKGCYYNKSIGLHDGCNAPDHVPENICTTEKVYTGEYKEEAQICLNLT